MAYPDLPAGDHASSLVGFGWDKQAIGAASAGC